ncbi:hypothetical protein FS749_001835 [Ceratobasidium sp. UAMH 11750]|nr:hypothetical protein FS749_001835 [Ceratobasidium sp. UAMH 11750]
MFYLRTSHMHNMPANEPKPTAPRSGFYAGCTWDEIVSISYPFGRESMATTAPPLPGLQHTGSKRNRLGGLVKSMTRLFRKDKTNKFKGTTSNDIKPLSSALGLKSSEVMFNASEFDSFGRQGIAGLGSGSESANALGKLIDAHLDWDVGPSNFLIFSDIPSEFPNPPASSPISAQRPVPSSKVSDGFVIGGGLVSVDRSAEPNQDSVYDGAQRSTLPPVLFFESHPPSGEFNHPDVFKHVSAHTVVVKLDEDQEPADYVTPGFLFPDYVRQRYPGAGQFAGTPRLTLSTSDWNISLQAIGEEDEEAADSYSPNDSESALKLAGDGYVRHRYQDNGLYADVPRLTHSTSGWNINLQVIGKEDEEAVDSYPSNDSESEPGPASDSGLSSPESTPPATPASANMSLLSPTTTSVSQKPTPSNGWAVIDEDEVGDDAIGIAL